MYSSRPPQQQVMGQQPLMQGVMMQQQGSPQQKYNYNQQQQVSPQMQQQMMMMMMQNGAMPMQSMAPIQPQLWPAGVGITDRSVAGAADAEKCSCPPIWCCLTRPVWFHDAEYTRGSDKQASQRFGCCCGWKIDDADVLGQKMSFEGKECCGIDSCWEPEIHIKSGGVAIGKAVMVLPCSCSCGEIDMCFVSDARGNKKYVRRENICMPMYLYWSGDFCGWQSYRWPVFPAGAPSVSATRQPMPIAHITYRFHACTICHPTWVGIEQMPDVPPEDQKLLVGMALCRWWRSEAQGKQQDAAF